MVPRALLGARRVVFASANPLVSVTGNSSPAAALICVFTLPKLPATTYYTIGRCPVARPYTRLAAVSSGVVPSSAASPRTSASANRAGDPASPHLPSKPRAQPQPSLCCRSVCAPAATQQLRLPCCAASTARHQTQLGKPGDLYQRKQTEALENFFPDFDAQPSAFPSTTTTTRQVNFFTQFFFAVCSSLPPLLLLLCRRRHPSTADVQRHRLNPGNRGIFKENKPKLSRIFFQPSA